MRSSRHATDIDITGTVRRTASSLVELVTGELIAIPSPELLADNPPGAGILKTFADNTFQEYFLHYTREACDDGTHHEFTFTSPEYDPVLNDYPVTQYDIIERVKLN